MAKKKIKLLMFPIHNEVIPQRLFRAFDDPEISKKFEIAGFAGRPSEYEIIGRLKQEIKKRKNYKKKWRSSHTAKEIKSLEEMIGLIENKTIPYYQLDDKNCKLPEKAYNSCDCVFIGTNNLNHAKYASDVLEHNKDFIIEKPLVINKKDLEVMKGLENLIECQKQKTGKKLTTKVTAHFAHKQACLALFNNIDELVKKYGKIRNVKGIYEEIDDPEKPRTKATLSEKISGGGIYLDTGCHLEIILTALGGYGKKYSTKNKAEFEWDAHQGYDVETYAKINHTIYNADKKRFAKEVNVEFIVGKFIDKYQNPMNKEHKEIILEFERGYNAHVLLSEGKIEIKKLNPKTKRENKSIIETVNKNYPSNEYINILNDFYDCKINRKKSFTGLSEGIMASEIILDIYKNFKNRKNHIKKYK